MWDICTHVTKYHSTLCLLPYKLSLKCLNGYTQANALNLYTYINTFIHILNLSSFIKHILLVWLKYFNIITNFLRGRFLFCYVMFHLLYICWNITILCMCKRKSFANIQTLHCRTTYKYYKRIFEVTFRRHKYFSIDIFNFHGPMETWKKILSFLLFIFLYLKKIFCLTTNK